jgi:dTDP-4-dehydrorhamnose 3,5-epimerase
MTRFKMKALPLNGLRLIERKVVSDERGRLSRLYDADELSAVGWNKPIVQINHTHTVKKGIVRGLHYQTLPHAEIKLVSCIQGEIFDVAVDLRAHSPTFLQWHAEVLSAKNNRALLIPEGFAHGFQALSDHVHLIYLHSANYHPEVEGALNVRDPCLAINWPIKIVKLSDRDETHPFIDSSFKGIEI